MSAVVGIDLSSKAIDLVKLDETSNRAEWVRVELAGANAWERTLSLRVGFPWDGRYKSADWWDDVFLCAIEAPYGRGQAGTNAILNRVVGAVAASLPASLRDPARCWLIPPHEWKAGLGLKAKPTWGDIERIAPGVLMFDRSPDEWADNTEHEQNARDAYCIALYARDLNAKAVNAA